MALIQAVPNSTPVPLSTAQLEALTTQQITNQLQTQFGNNIATFNRIYNLVWNNPQGLTPQQVLNGLGADATELFQLAVGMANYVNSIIPNTLPTTTPYAITFNQDGTVTVGALS